MEFRQVNSEMILLARESRGITQAELATLINLSQSHLSKIENGELPIHDINIEKIVEVLDYPTSFFCKKTPQYGLSMSYIFHRKRQSISRLLLKKIEANVNIKIMQLHGLLAGIEIESPNKFDNMNIQDYNNNPEGIAKSLRAKWKIPYGPIKNLIEVIENAGGFVFKDDLETNKIDALSIWTKITPPIFYVNRFIPTDRLRFSIAHELGHVIMHDTPTETLENEADRFASEFLMPENDIVNELQPFSLPKAMALKSKWRVSIASIVKRAYDLGIITKGKYSSLFREISCKGMRKEEPITLPDEAPCLFNKVLDIYRNQLGYSISELCNALNILPKNFIRVTAA